MDEPSSKHQLDAPCKNPSQEKLSEIKVTDPTHPLLGRSFPLLSTSTTLTGPGFAWVLYRDYMRLRIPLSATNLALSRPVLQTKLAPVAIEDLIALARQCEVLCQSNHEIFGTDYPKHSAAKSQQRSPRSSRR